MKTYNNSKEKNSLYKSLFRKFCAISYYEHVSGLHISQKFNYKEIITAIIKHSWEETIFLAYSFILNLLRVTPYLAVVSNS